jgi:hypothetical protein
MLKHSCRGFVLPYSLLLSSTILVLATLVLKEGQHTADRRQREALRQRTSSLLMQNMKPLVSHLENLVFGQRMCTALLRAEAGHSLFMTVGYPDDDSGAANLSSLPTSAPGGDVFFQSPVSGTVLQAGYEPLSPPDSPLKADLAWVAEDLALNPDPFPPPAIWPLPSWLHFPLRKRSEPMEILRELAVDTVMDGPWINLSESLPFTPGSSPSLVPVTGGLGLRFGIFASGKVGQREKVLRIRFYLEGTLWNPYNRALGMRSGSASGPAFQVVFWNLPEVRVENLTLGTSTGWMDIDSAVNPSTGATGIHGWIRTPGVIGSGASLSFIEPDSKWQPEGLARILHPAFMVGPADAVRISFRKNPAGIHAACLTTDAEDPLKKAEADAGWFRMESVPVEFEPIEFGRADDMPRPFYLSGGSLSFRDANTHVHLRLNNLGLSFTGQLDPRIRTLRWNDTYMDSTGARIRGSQLLGAEAKHPQKGNVMVKQLHQETAIFSWPDRMPGTLIAATDLPEWTNGFCLGSPGAVQVNAGLDLDAAWAHSPETVVAILPSRGGDLPEQNFIEGLPVNSLCPEYWEERLITSAKKKDNSLQFPYSLYPAPSGPLDFRTWTASEINRAARLITDHTGKHPVEAISAFFNRGILPSAFNHKGGGELLHNLLPMRGWLNSGPPLRRHGSAWILHMAIRLRDALKSTTRSARIWLLETRDLAGASRFEIVHFEWTLPHEHIRQTLLKS